MPTAWRDNLLTRAADVTPGAPPPVLMVRETLLNLAHLRNMVAVTEMGGIVSPPLPAFYHHPQTIDELVAETVGAGAGSCRASRAAQPKAWAGL